MEQKGKKRSLLFKSSFGIFMASVILTTALITTIYFFVKSVSFEYYKNTTSALARSTAAMLDGDRIKEIGDTMQQTDYYYEALDVLKKFQETNDVVSIYVQRVDTEKKVAIYLIDSDPNDPVPFGDAFPFAEENKDKPLSEIIGHPFVSETQFGWLCTATAAIYDSSGNYAANVGVDISMQNVQTQMRRILLCIVLIAVLVAAIIVTIVAFLLNRGIVKPITSLSRAASCYDSGMLLQDFSSELSRLKNPTGDEIEDLTISVQKMESDIKHYVRDLTTATAANERVSAELSIAAGIQEAMLPSVFPAFPDRDDFDLYATMHPAKEVGGDFYDFFLLDYDHLAVIAADVSGKGVPAALFMVIAKTLIRNQALYGLPPEKVFSKVNMQLCENNSGEMFVTAWMGVLELSTGKVVYANAGHTRPVIAHSDGRCEYVKSRANFVLGGMSMMQYTQGELQLAPGDTLFLYTDGVTEATDAAEQLYGEQQLLDAVSASSAADPQDMITAVKASIDGFVKEAPQFDDITMLAVKYKGEESGVYTETKTFIAVKSELDHVLEWLDALLERYDCPMKTMTQLNIAVEEIFINIASYAYPQGTSTCDITCHFSGSPVSLSVTFADKGVPYDPLKKKDPNTALSAEEREVGGLGIFMVKKSMDDVRYRYENGRNILTLTKSFA